MNRRRFFASLVAATVARKIPLQQTKVLYRDSDSVFFSGPLHRLNMNAYYGKTWCPVQGKVVPSAFYGGKEEFFRPGVPRSLDIVSAFPVRR